MSETYSVTTTPSTGEPANGMIEGLAAIAIAVLAILGLTSKSLADELASVATIVVGVALVAIGAEVISRYSAAAAAAGGGIGIEVLGGLVVIVLGILALLDVSRVTLLAVAIIVVGGSLLLGSRLGAPGGATRDAAIATASAQALVGATGVALGILALAGSTTQPQITLILVALLGYAGAILLSSAAITGRVVTMVRA
jgi:hypothetical protein